MQAIKQNFEKKEEPIMLTPITSSKSPNMLKKKLDKMLLKDKSQNNLGSMYTNISTSDNEMHFKTSKEKEDKTINKDKLSKNCQERENVCEINKDKESMLLNSFSIKDCSKEDKNLQKSATQVSVLNDSNCKMFETEMIEADQQENEVGDNKKNCLLASDDDELEGILLTDNNQTYLEKIIDILDSEESDLKYLLLAQNRNKRFTRKERRKMFVFCKICKKSFNYRTYTERHVFLHKSDRLMKCDTCSKGFVTKRELDSHKVVHSEDRSFTCKACGKTFKRLNYLTKHETTHLDTEPFKCNLCDKTYKSKELLKIHLQRHKSYTDYLCELCGKLFTSLTGLYAHKHVHGDQKKCSCSICGKNVSRSIHKHMKRHSEERPHICSYCGRCFKTKGVMKKHSLTHTDEKPYSCRICRKFFKQSASLYNHMHVHTGETPYPCKLCPSRFKYSHHLKNHLKVHN